MERLVKEVVHKNKELENSNVQLYACIFKLETNQLQVQQVVVATSQKIVVEKKALINTQRHDKKP